MNKTVLAFALALCVTMCSYVQEALSFPFCEGNEQVLFVCETGTKLASVCLNEKTGTSYYQFKKKNNKVELRIPYNRHKKNFKQAIEYYSGGFGRQIQITNHDTLYTLYSFRAKGMDEEGYMTPASGAGILVQKNGAIIAHLICEDGMGDDVEDRISKIYLETDYNDDYDDDDYWFNKFTSQ